MALVMSLLGRLGRGAGADGPGRRADPPVVIYLRRPPAGRTPSGRAGAPARSAAWTASATSYRPRLENGQVTYKVVDGPLKRMAEIARKHPESTYVLLIDEINRANVSKVL